MELLLWNCSSTMKKETCRILYIDTYEFPTGMWTPLSLKLDQAFSPAQKAPKPYVSVMPWNL